MNLRTQNWLFAAVTVCAVGGLAKYGWAQPSFFKHAAERATRCEVTKAKWQSLKAGGEDHEERVIGLLIKKVSKELKPCGVWLKPNEKAEAKRKLLIAHADNILVGLDKADKYLSTADIDAAIKEAKHAYEAAGIPKSNDLELELSRLSTSAKANLECRFNIMVPEHKTRQSSGCRFAF